MMQFSFTPQTEEEALQLLPNGVYKFLVQAAECKLSKTGNAMIELSLQVWDAKGIQHYMKDWLLPKVMYKLRHFCFATGLEKQYAAGTLTAHDCLGKTGYLKTSMEEASEQFAAKNKVADYMTQEKAEKTKMGKSSTTEKVASLEFQDDDIPF